MSEVSQIEKALQNKPDHFDLEMTREIFPNQLACQHHNSACCTLFGTGNLCYYIFHTSSFPRASFALHNIETELPTVAFVSDKIVKNQITMESNLLEFLSDFEACSIIFISKNVEC
jgi:hypothetical protein